MATQIPDDLLESNLTMPQVVKVMEKRRRIGVLQNRIDALPAKKMAMEGEIVKLQKEEDALRGEQ